MAASVEGVFRLIDRASPVLDRIERKAGSADRAVSKLGRSLDQAGSPKAEADLTRLNRKMDESGRTAQRTEVRYRMSMRQLERNVHSATRSAETDVGKLSAALEYLDGVTANPKIELEGEAQAIAMIRVVRSELNKLQREQAKVSLGGIVSGGAAAAGGAMGTVSRFFSKLADLPGAAIGKVISSWGVMIGLFVAAMPVIESLIGVLGALGSSLISAGVGAGAIAISGITGFVTAIGLVAPAVMTASSSIKEASEAWTAYNDAVETSGRNSKEARDALKVFEQTGRAGNIVRQMDAFKKSYQELTKPTQHTIFNIIEDTLARINDRWLPDIAKWTNQLFTGGAGRGGIEAGIGEFFQVLEDPRFKRSMDIVVDMLTRASPIVGRTFGWIARTFANIAAAAKPVVLDTLKGLREFFQDTAQGTNNIKDTRSALQPFLKDLDAIWKLLKQTGKLLGDLVGAGRKPGRSVIADMTDQVRDWRKAIEEDPGQVEGWFDKMVDRFGKFLDVFKQLVGALRDINRLIAPLVEKLADLANMDFGGVSGLQALAGYGLYRYARGRFGGGAPVPRGGGTPRAPTSGTGAPPVGPRVGGGARPAPVPKGQMPLPGMAPKGGGYLGGLGGRMLQGAKRIPFISALFAASGFANPSGPYKDAGVAGRGASALEAADPTRLLSLIFPDSPIAQKGLAGTIFRPLAKQVGAPLSAPASELQASAVSRLPGGGKVPFDFIRKRGKEVPGLTSATQLISPSKEDIGSGVFTAGWKEANRLIRAYERHQDRVTRKNAKMQETGMDWAKQLPKDEKALGKGVAAMLKHLKDLPKGAREEAANTAIGMAKVLEQRGKLPEGTAHALRMSITHEFGNMKVDSVKHSAEMTRGILDTQKSLTEGYHAAMKFIHDATSQGLEAVGGKALSWTVQNPGAAISGLTGAGASLTGAAGTVGAAAAAQGVGAGGTGAGGGGHGHGGGGPTRGATGMRLSGQGLYDNVPVGPGYLGAPGELLINRHTEDRINRMLPLDTSLDREVSREHRPHSAPKQRINEDAAFGRRLFQRGGRGGGRRGRAGGSGAPRTFQNIVQLGNWILGLGGYTVGENPAFGGVTGGHATNSYHYSGEAIDVNADAAPGGEKAALDRLYAMLQPLNLTELLWQVADHYDHLHAAMAGGAVSGVLGSGGAAGMAAAMPTPKIGQVLLKGPHTPQAEVAQRGINKVREAAQKHLEKQNRGGIGGGAMPGNYTGGKMTPEQVAQLAESVGLPGVTFAQIAMGESGLDPHAYGTDPGGTHGLGLWQITTGYNDELIARMGGVQAMFNPLKNAQAAKSIYDSSGIGAWYGTSFMTGANLHYNGGNVPGLARGGRLPFGGWFRGGGSFNASAPMLIGVGESGKEHVKVTPSGSGERAGGRGSGQGVHIEHIEIKNHRPGDIQKQLEREVGRALDNVSRKLETQGSDDASEVLG